jgi:hypothetical protein
MAPWKLPLIAAALVLPIAAGFALAGPGLGVAVAAVIVMGLVWIAARQTPRGPIGVEPPENGRRSILLIVTCAVEEPETVGRISALAGLSDEWGGADVLVLAPARIGFLDRWMSDVEGARQAAQRNLVATVAALAKAGVAAEARVGDEDVVQAAEDQLQSFAASEVVLVSGEDREDDAKAAGELRARLRPEFHHLVLDGSWGGRDEPG